MTGAVILLFFACRPARVCFARPFYGVLHCGWWWLFSTRNHMCSDLQHLYL